MQEIRTFFSQWGGERERERKEGRMGGREKGWERERKSKNGKAE